MSHCRKRRHLTISGLRDITAVLVALACAPGYAAPARVADLTDLSLEQLVRRVGSLPQPMLPGYTAVDARWGWGRLRWAPC